MIALHKIAIVARIWMGDKLKGEQTLLISQHFSPTTEADWT